MNTKSKLLLILSLVTSAYCLVSSPVHAAFVHILPDGKTIWNVLGDETALTVQKPEKIDITNVTNNNLALSDAQVSLTKTAGSDNVVLDVKNETGDHQADVTNIKDNLVEIESRPQTQKIAISYKEGNFLITENGNTAKTVFPITVDAKTNQLSVTTPSGSRVLTVLPYEATANALKANLLTQEPDSSEITENANGQLSYLLAGKKELNFFNLFPYKFDTKVYISAVTGEVLKVDSPGWLKILGFLFS